MKETIFLVGTVMLGLAGGGAGYLLYLKKLKQWRSVHLFLRLLQYILDGIRYLGLPCMDLLSMAAANAIFDDVDLKRCASFGSIPIPARIEWVAGGELRAGFSLIERSNSEYACAELQRMIERCRTIEKDALAEAHHAHTLYPKLGFCLGTLIAVVLA